MGVSRSPLKFLEAEEEGNTKGCGTKSEHDGQIPEAADTARKRS